MPKRSFTMKVGKLNFFLTRRSRPKIILYFDFFRNDDTGYIYHGPEHI